MYANAVYGICARSDVPTVIGIDLQRVKAALGGGIIVTAPFVLILRSRRYCLMSTRWRVERY
jgi:hypothetical protein